MATCEVCSKPFETRSRKARFCSSTCRSRAHRGVDLTDPGSDSADTRAQSASLVAQVTADLEGAGVLDTTSGQQAVLLAQRMANPGVDTGSAVASLSKRLSELMVEAMESAAPVSDPLDELKALRDNKRRAG